VAQRTGGHLGRKIVFNTAMGEVLVRVLTQTLTVTGPGRVRRAV
jgi:chemotaxis receptor (MCP) glutamine deamidase CheD